MRDDNLDKNTFKTFPIKQKTKQKPRIKTGNNGEASPIY